MYEDRNRIQNYDPEIHEEYLIHDTLFPTTSFIAMCIIIDCSIAINTK